MIELIIDDKKILAQENQTVLQAARENRIKIPHLCFHPALKPSGSCRLCGVEVASPPGKKKVMLSCSLKVKEHMEIWTDSAVVQAHRVKAFNTLLQMAPDAVRIRDLANEFGVAVTPLPDGCIRCRLCIRICNEVVKAHALKMIKTENGGRVAPEPGHCIGCGTCANLCPTQFIRIKDQDGIRTISLKNEIIGQLPMEQCEGCGKMYATTRFLRHVEEITQQHPNTKEHHHLCSSCIKLLSSRAMAEKEKIRK